MAKRSWAGLSPAYRQRLERGGVTRKQYEAGKSLGEARGHGKTPERPERAPKNPDKYKDYIAARRKLVVDVIKRKADLYGDRIKWKDERGEQNVRHPLKPVEGDPSAAWVEMRNPNWAAMRRFLKMSQAEIDEIDWADMDTREEYSFLFYH